MSVLQKRQRDDDAEPNGPESLSRAISPPSKRRRHLTCISSPWQLTWIRDLPEELNRDAITLKDLLGDPLISECWQFNYLHDIPFIMDAFDRDTRHLVKLNIVHGFWKREDPRRLMLMKQASEFDNVRLHVAPMPEMFGTHHSKMMILLRHDDTAQIIIHTANMISKDWTNLTNAVWKSHLLPKYASPSSEIYRDPEQFAIGSGERFKVDLSNYLASYDSHKVTCKPLVEELGLYDFSCIKAAFVASVPGRHDIHDLSRTSWGWAGLKRCLKTIECEDGDSEVVVQISSIATLGGKDEWLQNSLFGALSASHKRAAKRPRFKVVFPTADEIRSSLDGYASGGSIHTKIRSQQQIRQLEYMRPMFHHWANDSASGLALSQDVNAEDGGRNRAAPHIKTYIRYNQHNLIDWALLTSANLSKQAWGEAARPATGEARVASWEVGVMLWPGLFGSQAVMMGSFQSDNANVDATAWGEEGKTVIGLRMPYSVPLQRYAQGEKPWVASDTHDTPDWRGCRWEPAE